MPITIEQKQKLVVLQRQLFDTANSLAPSNAAALLHGAASLVWIAVSETDEDAAEKARDFLYGMANSIISLAKVLEK